MTTEMKYCVLLFIISTAFGSEETTDIDIDDETTTEELITNENDVDFESEFLKHQQRPSQEDDTFQTARTTVYEIRTISTVDYCYATAGTITTACKKKKRSLSDGSVEIGETEGDIEATKVSSSYTDVMEKELSPRTGRFFLFLQLTSTLTSSVTSYTATSSYTVVGCIPSWHNQCW